MTTRRRERIAEGIYRDQYGLAGTVKVGRIQREQRFPPDHPLDAVKAWRTRTKADLTDDRQEAGSIDEPVP